MVHATVGPLPDGTVGFDFTSPLSVIHAQQFQNQGLGFVVRYVGREEPSKFADLTEPEAQAILSAGLGLGVVQHPRAPGWAPTAQLGQQFGAAAARLVGAAGLPQGITVWVDLEEVASGTTPQDAIDYCNAWFDQVSAVGYIPGVYIGANPGLTADQLYWDIHMKSYWRGGSSVKAGVPLDIPNRGYQMTQRIDGPPSNEFDHNVVMTDHFGGAVKWCLPI